MEKKLISLLLAVLMMFSALPITVFAAESEYPESEHPYGYGDYEWIYEGKPGTKSLSVTFSDKTEFHEYEYLSFYDQNGNWIGSAGNELAGKTVDFNASSLKIGLYSWNSGSSHYGFKITNIRENNYEVDGTVIPGEDCKITEDRSTGTITFEPIIFESDDGYISSYSVFGSSTVKWVKRIVVKPGFNDTINFNAFVNAEVLDFAEDFYFSRWDISDTAFYKNKSNWDNESLYLGNKLVILGENDKIKDGTKFICSEAIDYYKDIIIPDSVIYIGEYNNSKSIMCIRGSYAETWAKEKEIKCICVGDLKVKFKNCIISKGTPLSSAIEVYKLSSDYTWKQITEYSSSGYSSSKVGAQTVTISDGDASLDFIIALSNDKNEYINFKDQSLYEELISCSVDKNEDGIISVAEMRAYDGDISLDDVKDISGLEYADSIGGIYNYNPEIYIEDYFILQKYIDLTCLPAKVDKKFFVENGRLRFLGMRGNLYYDKNESKNCEVTDIMKIISSDESVAYYDGTNLNLVKSGEAVITVSIGSVSKNFTVHVKSTDFYNDLGNKSNQVPSLLAGAIVNNADGDVFQIENGNLKRINSNKNVLMSSFYPGRDENGMYSSTYYITSDNELWQSENKIGNGFKKITNSQEKYISNYGLALDNNGNCYHLQNYQLIAKNVIDIEGSFYLTKSGEIYKCFDKTFSEINPKSVKCADNVERIINADPNECFYISNDKKTYRIQAPDYDWVSATEVVNHEVKDIDVYYGAYYLDDNDTLWCKMKDQKVEKLFDNVVSLKRNDLSKKGFITDNGDYYTLSSLLSYDENWNYIAKIGEPTLTNVQKVGDNFYLNKNKELYIRNTVSEKIMTDVVNFQECIVGINYNDYYVIFTRTDGSVWSYTVGDEEPIKLLEGEDYTPEHTHTLNHITVPSTCKVAGMEYDICSECGETFNEKTLPLAAHTWSDWTVVKEATTTAEGQEKRICSVCDKVETRAIEKLKVLKDDKTGIEINYNDEYDSDTEIKVEEQFSGKSFQLINTEFGKVNSKIYDIATYKDGVKVQPNGEITVKVPLPDGFTTNKVFVCYVDSVSGKVTKIPCEVKDGYVIFKTNHFSEYAIVEQSANVKSVSVSDIKLNYKKSATIKPTIKADEGAKYTVKYSSSNTKVATVDENGKVYAAKKGSATITCTVTDSNGNTVQDTCKVTVKYSFGQWLIKILLFGWIWY